MFRPGATRACIMTAEAPDPIMALQAQPREQIYEARTSYSKRYDHALGYTPVSAGYFPYPPASVFFATDTGKESRYRGRF